eukprot:m.437366 g.437366  ORF g.437366 m.437366 type:complete len:317 (-) comp20272_c1_seq4:519-1469(-)
MTCSPTAKPASPRSKNSTRPWGSCSCISSSRTWTLSSKATPAVACSPTKRPSSATPRDLLPPQTLAQQLSISAIVVYGMLAEYSKQRHLLLTWVIDPSKETAELHQQPLNTKGFGGLVGSSRGNRSAVDGSNGKGTKDTTDTAVVMTSDVTDNGDKQATSLPLAALIEPARLRDCEARSGACELDIPIEAGDRGGKKAATPPPNQPEGAAKPAQPEQATTQPSSKPTPSNDATVVFVPHKALHLVPFAALLDSQGTPLLAHCAVSCAPSLHVLQTSGTKRRPRQRSSVEIRPAVPRLTKPHPRHSPPSSVTRHPCC